MNAIQKTNFAAPARWEDYQAPAALGPRLDFVRGMVGMPRWILDAPVTPRPAANTEFEPGFVRRMLRVAGQRIRRRLQITRERFEARAEIQALSRLDDRLLRDIGLHRGQVERLRSGFATIAEIDIERSSLPVSETADEATVPLSPVAQAGHVASVLATGLSRVA